MTLNIGDRIEMQGHLYDVAGPDAPGDHVVTVNRTGATFKLHPVPPAPVMPRIKQSRSRPYLKRKKGRS